MMTLLFDHSPITISFVLNESEKCAAFQLLTRFQLLIQHNKRTVKLGGVKNNSAIAKMIVLIGCRSMGFAIGEAEAQAFYQSFTRIAPESQQNYLISPDVITSKSSLICLGHFLKFANDCK